MWQRSTPTVYEHGKKLHLQDCPCKLNRNIRKCALNLEEIVLGFV
jgi:hypothetical protein